ncbi:MAG: hypothetical protein BWY78_01195 [Alphaproteobacteria bacterium ADurb.Bin438]|nr:MAG: hypothetical protein BWY78_01195 [Alphaproteobacteria bacterium ADurb.Bin438]
MEKDKDEKLTFKIFILFLAVFLPFIALFIVIIKKPFSSEKSNNFVIGICLIFSLFFISAVNTDVEDTKKKVELKDGKINEKYTVIKDSLKKVGVNNVINIEEVFNENDEIRYDIQSEYYENIRVSFENGELVLIGCFKYPEDRYLFRDNKILNKAEDILLNKKYKEPLKYYTLNFLINKFKDASLGQIVYGRNKDGSFFTTFEFTAKNGLREKIETRGQLTFKKINEASNDFSIINFSMENPYSFIK